jgi:hypothetical protein
MDTENDLGAYEMSPPDFCLDPNDDNLIIGIPDDTPSVADDSHKAKETTTASAAASAGGAETAADKQRSEKAKAEQSLKMKQAGSGKSALNSRDEPETEGVRDFTYWQSK